MWKAGHCPNVPDLAFGGVTKECFPSHGNEVRTLTAVLKKPSFISLIV